MVVTETLAGGHVAGQVDRHDLCRTPGEPVGRESDLQQALETAIRIGDDTDTVAAIAGALLGARWGASAVPAEWRRVLHGWPGARAKDLVELALLAIGRGKPDRHGWPGVDRIDYTDFPGYHSYALHPQDPGVHLSGAGRLDSLPDGVDAVVSLCRLGSAQVPEAVRGGHIDV